MVSADTVVPTSSSLLRGRRVFVTGAAGAIGSAIAAAVEHHGGIALRSDLSAASMDFAFDVTNESAVFAALTGDDQITDIVHAAGSLIVGPLSDMSLDDYRKTMDVNLKSAFLIGRVASRVLPRGGSLTMIASQAGFRGGMHWGLYCAAKAGVISLCESLAKELGGSGIRVNSLCPGNVDTPMSREAISHLSRLKARPHGEITAQSIAAIPLGRYADVREIADVCVFLISPLASYVSGAAIAVDGGEVSA